MQLQLAGRSAGDSSAATGTALPHSGMSAGDSNTVAVCRSSKGGSAEKEARHRCGGAAILDG